MKFLLLLTTILLSACSSSYDIPDDKFGILFKYGEIQRYVTGPAKLEKTIFIENIILINKTYKIALNNDQYSIQYTVTDPVKYYKIARGDRSILELLEKELENLALKGKTIHTKAELDKVIDDMKLPIVIKKITER